MMYAICNPTAGNGRSMETGRMIQEKMKDLGLDLCMLWTEKAGHATDLARDAAQAGAETVLSIGGDGTALEVARGLSGTQTALGVIPAGTGNDFIKTLGLPRQPEKALEYILAHSAQPTDVGEINGRMFLNEIGTGFDVSVLDYAEKAKKYCKGLLPYLYGVVKTLFRFRSIPITYTEEDGKTATKDAFVVGVGNGGIIGGGIPIAPDARADDGLLDVVVVGKISKIKLPVRLIGLMRGKILSFPETRHFRTTAISFSAPNMRVNVDGEIVPEEKVEARILPWALRIHR